MNPILQKIKDDKLRICQCGWCKKCPLFLTGYNGRKNIFIDIAKEFDVDVNDIRYRFLPSSFCAKQFIIHKSNDWKNKFDELCDEIGDKSFDESYELILNKFSKDINYLRKMIKSRLTYYEKHKNDRVGCKSYTCKKNRVGNHCDKDCENKVV